MMQILHVDDDSLWRGIVKRALENPNIKVHSFADLARAKEATEIASFEFDLCICDGSIDSDRDGERWAEELHIQGHQVLVLSGKAVKGKVPFILKSKFEPAEIMKQLKKIPHPLTPEEIAVAGRIEEETREAEKGEQPPIAT